jgi:hypothetical protein
MDLKNVICLHPYWLATVSQLTTCRLSITTQGFLAMTAHLLAVWSGFSLSIHSIENGEDYTHTKENTVPQSLFTCVAAQWLTLSAIMSQYTVTQ